MHNDIQIDLNSQGYKSIEIDAVTVKISVTEYHH